MAKLCARFEATCLGIIIAATPGCLRAQAIGVLDPGPIKERSLRDARVERVARLLVDPSLSNPLRASAWALSFNARTENSEAKIQLNLAGIVVDDSSSLSLGLIGPVNKKEPVSELADLNGLTGTTRVEVAWTKSIAAATHRKFYARVSGAAPKLEYRTVPGLNSAAVRRAAYNASAGIAFTTSASVVRVGYRYEETYKNAAPHSVCIPADLGVANAFTCTSLVIGAPKRSTRNIIDGEYRVAFAKYISASVSISHSVNSGVTGIDVPIWMIPDASGSFGGGIRLGLRSDGHRHPTVSIFVGHFKL
jgi:hypothetical protein